MENVVDKELTTTEDAAADLDEVMDAGAEAEAAALAEAAAARVRAVVDHIRSESRAARLTSPAVFAAEPFSYTKDELEALWEAIAADPELADIVRTPDERTGEESLHCEKYLSVPYARLLLRSQANDPAFMIAQTVRDNSEIYPRPTSVAFFEFEPFSLELAEVFAHLTVMASLEEYADVKRVTVSNGMVYLYSDRFLTEPVARNMAQWDEVDKYLNSNQ